jgi:sec-independent protein translocase protein TatA
MTTQSAFGLGGQELLIVLFILLLLFGGTRLPRLARGLGQSVREFKKGVASPSEAEVDAAETRQLS